MDMKKEYQWVVRPSYVEENQVLTDWAEEVYTKAGFLKIVMIDEPKDVKINKKGVKLDEA